HDRDREAAARAVGFALELVAVAGAASDPALTDARTETLPRSRTDRLELHLMASALDERRGLIDGVREQDFLTGGVIEQPATAIAHEIADDECHLDRVATEARLIAADNHVATLGFCEEPTQTGAAKEIVTSAAIVGIVDARFIREVHTCDVLVAALRLH